MVGITTIRLRILLENMCEGQGYTDSAGVRSRSSRNVMLSTKCTNPSISVSMRQFLPQTFELVKIKKEYKRSIKRKEDPMCENKIELKVILNVSIKLRQTRSKAEEVIFLPVKIIIEMRGKSCLEDHNIFTNPKFCAQVVILSTMVPPP